MATKSERKTLMKRFGAWLRKNNKTQNWAGPLVGVYSGYLSNLVTGKQIAGQEVCDKAEELMKLGRFPPDKPEPEIRPTKRKTARKKTKVKKKITTWEEPTKKPVVVPPDLRW